MNYKDLSKIKEKECQVLIHINEYVKVVHYQDKKQTTIEILTLTLALPIIIIIIT